MKTQTIYKGFHRPFQLIPAYFRFFSRQKWFRIYREVIFTNTCKYILDNGDQEDWNKLFGFCFGIFGIHTNSARFAWRYSPDTGMIEIAVYCYQDGIRTYTTVSKIKIGEPVWLEIKRNYSTISFLVDLNCIHHITLASNKPAFGCGLYFGGNRRATQNITIKIQ